MMPGCCSRRRKILRLYLRTIGRQFLTVALVAHAVLFLLKFSSVEEYQRIFSCYHDIIDCGTEVENLCLLSEV